MSVSNTAFDPPVDASGTNRIVPVCVLGDGSGSMSAGPGDRRPIDVLNEGLSTLITTLQVHPEAADTAFVEIIDFSDTSTVVMPFSHVSTAAVPPGIVPKGGTAFGPAFSLARREIDAMIAREKANGATVYRPTIYLITDGYPTDSGWEQELDTLMAAPFAPIVCAFGVHGADEGVLRSIARRDRGQAWLADNGDDPAAAFEALFPSLIRTVMASATAAAAGVPVPPPVPVSLPGMTALVPV
jgi:uncharacterized protein YegL